MINRYFLYILLIGCFASCTNEVDYDDFKRIEEVPKGFVYLDQTDSFKIDNQFFFPKLMNYVVQPRFIDGKIIFSPSLEYDDPNTFDSETEAESNERLRTHIRVIKKMGFNSIRLVGLNKVEFQSPRITMEVFEGLKRVKLHLGKRSKSSILEGFQSIIDIAREEEIRIMVLLPKPLKDEDYTKQKDEFVFEVLKRFKDENAIFSYDFFNEPVYFDEGNQPENKGSKRDKSSAFKLVKKWRYQMRQVAPYQLLTISFAEPIEVFEWDPSILPVDFVSIHTYHPLRVPNEIYWFSKYVKKPWIISETSLPADNDSISYADQGIFMKEMLERVNNCGGLGMGWWQYQDVQWGPFEHNYTPLIKSGGQTIIDSNNFILGEFKDAASLLPTLGLEKTGECDCHENYYNMMGYHNYKVNGKIVDEDGEPIEGAVIRGWNRSWKIGMNTFTNETGEFNLYSNDECYHYEISAPGYTNEKFDKELKYSPDPKTLEFENVGLEYHSNHFQWYLDTSFIGESVFTFKKESFNQFKTRSSLGTIELELLDL